MCEPWCYATLGSSAGLVGVRNPGFTVPLKLGNPAFTLPLHLGTPCILGLLALQSIGTLASSEPRVFNRIRVFFSNVCAGRMVVRVVWLCGSYGCAGRMVVRVVWLCGSYGCAGRMVVRVVWFGSRGGAALLV